MKKKRKRYYRSPRTQQEKKCYRENREYIRGKRSPSNLPSSWDDIKCCVQKTWKVKREKQYRCGKRGKRYEILLDNRSCEYYTIEYLEQNDIPYQLVKEFHRWRRNKRWVTKHKLVIWTDKLKILPMQRWDIGRDYYYSTKYWIDLK